jgi:hypothetical protein
MKVKSPLLRGIDLKQEDFIREIPENVKLELVVHFKGGNKYRPEYINPLKTLVKSKGKLKAVNRNNPDIAYTFDLKEVAKAFLIPMEF